MALALGAANPVARAEVPPQAQRIRLANDSDFRHYYSWTEQGFERGQAGTALNKGLEIFHEVVDAKGRPTTEVRLGDEVTVRVRVRSLGQGRIDNVALVDMLPGGLEPVLQAASDEEDEGEQDAPLWKKRLAVSGSWELQYADIREDRVVFYGSVGQDLQEISYKARATNVGDYTVPPAYGEAMYERRIFSRSAAGRLRVTADH